MGREGGEWEYKEEVQDREEKREREGKEKRREKGDGCLRF